MSTTDEHTTVVSAAAFEVSAEVLATLTEIGEEVNASLDLDEVLARTAALIKRHIDYEIFGVLMFEGDGSYLKHRFSIGYPRELVENLRIPLGQGISGTAAATGHSVRVGDTSKDPRSINAIENDRSQLAVPLMLQNRIVGAATMLKEPVLVPDVTQDPRYVMANPETRSELPIPMIHKGKVIGVLDLESPQLNYFTEDHVQTLSILAANLAVSLENARLYEQVARDEARLERDLQAAKRIQGALLRPVPTEDYGVDLAARYLSAREVCGDLYEFLRYGSQQLGLALGDVSGKGTAAALYGAVSIGIMRSLAPQKLQPAEMLRQMNQLVGERRIEGRLMTACFATWQRGRRKLRVANAGQSQPLLYKDRRCGKIELTGFPLGIYEDVSYDEWGVTLEPGDILVFHSDGIAETTNTEGQFFGTERLRKLIEDKHEAGAAELADLVLREVDWFSQSAPLSDDRTLVVLKVR